MLSEKQRRGIIKDLSIILKEMPNSKNIEEISKKTGIPRSTIQRYLNRKDYFVELINYNFINSQKTLELLFEEVQKWLVDSKNRGRSKGGITSQHKYYENKDYQRDSLGKYTSRK